jgi:antirestriction protein ArdC
MTCLTVGPSFTFMNCCWLIELLKGDKRAFFTTCSKAARAAEYLRGFALTETVAA